MRGCSAAVAIALLLLIPGCMSAVTPGAAILQQSTSWDARMRTFLKAEYARPDMVQDDAVHIVSEGDQTVGDVPVHVVVATVNHDGKEAVAFFDASSGRYISSFPPDYYRASGGKLGFDAKTFAASHPDEATDYFVDFGLPPGFVLADQISDPARIDPALAAALGADVAQLAQNARERPLSADELAQYVEASYAAQWRTNLRTLQDYLAARRDALMAVPGVTRASFYESTIAPRIFISATPAALPLIIARSDVLALDKVPDPSTTQWNFAIARGAIQADTLNNAGIWGSGTKIASVDSGVNDVSINGVVCLHPNQAMQFGTDPGTGDPADHGTAIAWEIIGGKHAADNSICTNMGRPYGISRDATFLNAKVADTLTPWDETNIERAISYVVGTFQANTATTSAGDSTTDWGGNYVFTKYLDYSVWSSNRMFSVTPGNSASTITAPGGAMNALVVNMYDDHNTTSLSGDSIPPSAPNVNPPSGYAQKPDIGYPGWWIDLPHSNGVWGSPSGTSFAAPMAGAGMNLEPTIYSGLDKKCHQITSTYSGSWQPGWNWGQGQLANARNFDGGLADGVTQAQAKWIDNIVVPAGATLYASLVWYREFSSASTVSRFSDLDLALYDAAHLNQPASSASAANSIEHIKWTNTAATSQTMSLRTYGYTVSGAAQPFTMCYDIH